MIYSKIISEGDKIEFRKILTPEEDDEGKKPDSYVSQVFDFTDEGNIKVAMPIFKGKLIPLSKGAKFDAFFFTSKGLYQCKVVIMDRYKSGNIYTMEISLRTELQKYQRRQYYRLEKSLPIFYTELTDEDYLSMIETRKFPEDLKDIASYDKGTTADISGGGLRFIGRTKIASGKKILVIFDVIGEREQTKFRLPASVILSFELPNRVGFYEHRIEFENISKSYREMLIKYIFEEERRMRKNVK